MIQYCLCCVRKSEKTHHCTQMRHTTVRQAQPSLSGSPRLRGLRARQPRLSVEARIILDSIIKCHVITRYGAVLSCAPSPPGCCSPSDRYGEVCVCTRVSACLLYPTCLQLAEGLMEAGGDRGGRCGVGSGNGMDGAEGRNWH